MRGANSIKACDILASEYGAALMAEMLETRVDRLEAALVRLAEAQARTDEQLVTLTARVDQLTERVDQLTSRVGLLAVRMDQLTVRMDQLAVRLDRLTEHVDQLTVRVEELAAHTGRLTDRVGMLTGYFLEERYRSRAPAYFDDLLLRIHTLRAEELANVLDEALERGAITRAERRDLLRADVIVRGRRPEENVVSYLAVEVSAVIDEDDVWRAVRRAQLLGQATGAVALPVVAGEQSTKEADELSSSQQVWQVLDGRTVAPQASRGE